jgi:hypothetical protein
MTDRIKELALAFEFNPWADPHMRRVCRELINKWDKEDIQTSDQISPTSTHHNRGVVPL